MINSCLGGKSFRRKLAEPCLGRRIWGTARGGHGFREHGAHFGAATTVLPAVDAVRGDTTPAGQHPFLPQKALAPRSEITGPQKFHAGRVHTKDKESAQCNFPCS